MHAERNIVMVDLSVCLYTLSKLNGDFSRKCYFSTSVLSAAVDVPSEFCNGGWAQKLE